MAQWDTLQVVSLIVDVEWKDLHQQFELKQDVKHSENFSQWNFYLDMTLI